MHNFKDKVLGIKLNEGKKRRLCFGVLPYPAIEEYWCLNKPNELLNVMTFRSSLLAFMHKCIFCFVLTPGGSCLRTRII
jgi:hypothetical protein